MQKSIKSLITLFAAGLFLWLLWGFWSLGNAVSGFVTVLIVIVTGLSLFGAYKQQKHFNVVDQRFIDALPADSYQGAVILVCGQSRALFSENETKRETSQGWYIPVDAPADLAHIVQSMARTKPSLLNQLSVLFALLPEQITNLEILAQETLNWRRAIGESRLKINKRLPFWVSLYVSLSDATWATGNEPFPWITQSDRQQEFHVEEGGHVAVPFSVWLNSHSKDTKLNLQRSLWFDTLLQWLNIEFIPMLSSSQTGAPKLSPSGWAVQWIDIDSQPHNVWAQFVQHKTQLSLLSSQQISDRLPLPEVMLHDLHYDINLTSRERTLGIIGLISGLFLLGALCGSYHHNQQLIRHIGEDVARFSLLSDTPLSPKLTAYQQLQDDAAELARWEREGIPSAYSLALYQGNRILPYLHTLLGGWAPPPPPAPIIVQNAPEMVRLDSLSLFDVGQSTLKASATKVLVDALLNIKAKPGWLIVVSGYTDNTGNPELNQKLSLKRAESVRDWMIETSDINPACFAVQGDGQNNPIADNQTAEGRAKNRRVEIRLIPQADACQGADNQTVSPMDVDTHSTQKEK
ncbi:TPA: OmpA family protein [Providencia rettgeri]|nr:OmpA family protein [Providencia rettgeri]